MHVQIVWQICKTMLLIPADHFFMNFAETCLGHYFCFLIAQNSSRAHILMSALQAITSVIVQGRPPVDLYLISEKSIWKNEV